MGIFEDYKNRIDQDITNQEDPNTIPPETVGKRFKELADITKDQVAIGPGIDMGVATPETDPGVLDGPAKWDVIVPGIYTNLGGLELLSGNTGKIFYNGSTFEIIQVPIPQPENKIEAWVAGDYLTGDQRSYVGKDWVLNADATESDVPGVSEKWIPRLDFFTKSETDTKVSAKIDKSNLVPGINLFNKDTVTPGYYVAYATGLLMPNALTTASDFIKVLPNTQYVKQNTGQLAFYNVDKVYISGIAVPTGGRFTTPAETAYTRITTENSILATQQVKLGSVLGTYIPYVEFFEKIGVKVENVSGLPAVADLVTGQNIDNKFGLAITSSNLFNKDTATIGSFISYSTGAVTAGASFNASAFIPVLPATEYIKRNTQQLAFYDINKVYVSGLSTTPGGLFTTPGNAYFTRLTTENTVLNTQQLNLGNTLLAYDSFSFGRPDQYVRANRIVGFPEVVDIVTAQNMDSKFGLSGISNNLFNKATVTPGNFVAWSTGLLSVSANYNASDYIPVLPSSKYVKANTQQMAFYDANKVYISGIASTTGYFTTPSNVAYIRITTENTLLETQRVNNGEVLLAYKPFLYGRSNLGVAAENVVGLENVVSRDVKILLPSEINLIKGQNFSIYFKNVLKYSKYAEENGYSVRVQKKNIDGSYSMFGEGYPYKWDITPADATDFQIEIRVTNDYDGTIVDRKVIDCNVVDPALIEGKVVKGVTIGDSFTDGWGVSAALGEFLNSYSAGVTASLIGKNDSGNPLYKDDAWSGKDYNFFYNSQYGYLRPERPLSEGVFAAGWGLNEPNGWTAGQTYADLTQAQIDHGQSVNEFYNSSTGKFDFTYYINTYFPTIVPKSLGSNNVNFFISYLGINDSWNKEPNILKTEITAKYIAMLTHIFNSVHSFDPEIKIFVGTITPQPYPSKFMSDYGATWRTSNKVKYCQEIWNEFIINTFDTPVWKATGLYVMPTAAHFDTRTSLRSQTYHPCKFNTEYEEYWDFDIHPFSETGGKYLGDAGAMAIYNRGL